jgi:hypothetical protein
MPPGAKSRAGVSTHWLAEALARLAPDVRGRAQKHPSSLYTRRKSAPSLLWRRVFVLAVAKTGQYRAAG